MTGDQILHFLKKWVVPVASVVLVVGAFFGAMRYVIRSEVADMRSDIGSLKDSTRSLGLESKDTNNRVDGLLKEALERAFPKPSATKDEVRGSLKSADDILQLARNHNVKLDPSLLENYGKDVAALGNQPAVSAIAWRTLTSLIDYRSFANSLPPAVAIPSNMQRVAPVHTRYHFGIVAGTPMPVMSTGGPTSKENAAELDQIGVNDNKDAPAGDSVLLIEGGTVGLDGYHMKNVVFRNTHILYAGGPVQLQNVTFLNCTFSLVQRPQTQMLAQKILELSSSVTFSASG
jgi:hypothetical protein